jgi:choline dehydrogenase-like flavoprotein
MARRVAATEPMASWVKREVFPGSAVQSDAELAELMRATNHTVYHVSCTCRIGPDHDPLAVLDPQLRVRGVRGVSVADASAFPSLTTVNPVIAVMMLGERAGSHPCAPGLLNTNRAPTRPTPAGAADPHAAI